MQWDEKENRAEAKMHVGTTPCFKHHPIHLVAYYSEPGADGMFWARWHAQTNSAVDDSVQLYTVTGEARAYDAVHADAMARWYATKAGESMKHLLGEELRYRPELAAAALATRLKNEETEPL